MLKKFNLKSQIQKSKPDPQSRFFIAQNRKEEVRNERP